MSGVPPAVADILTILFPFISILAFVATIGIAWVIFRDAQERGIAESTATIWGLGVASLFPVVAPLYFILVVRSRNRETAVTIRERWVAWLWFSLFFSFAFTTPRSFHSGSQPTHSIAPGSRRDVYNTNKNQLSVIIQPTKMIDG
jgi:hypothetical protein